MVTETARTRDARDDGGGPPVAVPLPPVRTALPAVLPAASYGALVSFIRSRPGMTRQQLLAATGMSRTTLFERLEALFQHGYVYQDGSAPPGTGGRGPGRRWPGIAC